MDPAFAQIKLKAAAFGLDAHPSQRVLTAGLSECAEAKLGLLVPLRAHPNAVWFASCR